MIARLILLFLALSLAAPAAAHLTPNSEIGIDIGQKRVKLTVSVPMAELRYAGVPDMPPARLGAYLLDHLWIGDTGGWRTTIDGVRVSDGAAPNLIATVMADPPAGISPRRFRLRYDAVIDAVPDHFVLVLLGSDFEAGMLSEKPRMLWGLRQGSETLLVDLAQGSAWRGFVGAVGLGMHHIAEGYDHLLFLIALLLPAPLVAAGRRWGGYAGRRHMITALVRIVTAFTIGHSMTLIGGAFFGWALPTRPVESLIAVSIMISALHALLPFFAGREAIVAGLFGLVHGLAFATLIGRFGIEPWQKAQSILGFNIGIELVQLLVVALVAPGLLMLARTRYYSVFRCTMAVGAGSVATIWFVERAFGGAIS